MKKKRVIILSVLLCVLFLSEAYGATYSTISQPVSSQSYRIRGRAYWQYETGKYASRGEPIIETKPRDSIFTTYLLDYGSTHVYNQFKVSQTYRPRYYSSLTSKSTYGRYFSVTVNSSGPR